MRHNKLGVLAQLGEHLPCKQKVIVGGAHFELQKSPKRKAVPIDSQQEDSLNVDLTLYSHNSEYNENIKQKSLPVAIESIFR